MEKCLKFKKSSVKSEGGGKLWKISFYHEISFFGQNGHWKLVKIEGVELGKMSNIKSE